VISFILKSSKSAKQKLYLLLKMASHASLFDSALEEVFEFLYFKVPTKSLAPLTKEETTQETTQKLSSDVQTQILSYFQDHPYAISTDLVDSIKSTISELNIFEDKENKLNQQILILLSLNLK